MDNAAENQMLKKQSIKEGLGIKIEQAVPNTPKQNSIVECAIATVYEGVRGIMNAAGYTCGQETMHGWNVHQQQQKWKQ